MTMFQYPENAIPHVAASWEKLIVANACGEQTYSDTSCIPEAWRKRFENAESQWQIDFTTVGPHDQRVTVVMRYKDTNFTEPQAKCAVSLAYSDDDSAYLLRVSLAPAMLELPDDLLREARLVYVRARSNWFWFTQRAALVAVEPLVDAHLSYPQLREAAGGGWELAFDSPAVPDIALASTGGYPLAVCGEIAVPYVPLAQTAEERAVCAAAALTMEDFL